MLPLDYETPDPGRIVVLKAKRRTIGACGFILTAAACLLLGFVLQQYEEAIGLLVLFWFFLLIGWIVALMGVIGCRNGLREGGNNHKLRIMLIICGVIVLAPLATGAIMTLYLRLTRR